MTEPRRIDRFAERLDALGPNVARWPEADAAEARDLLARSGEARALLDDARRLFRLVAEAAHAEPPAGLAFRIMADVAARRADRLSWLVGSPARFGLASAGFCVAALAIGVALGSATAPAQAVGQDLDLGAAFALSIADGDF